MNADLLLIGSSPTTFLRTSSDRLVDLDSGLGFSFYTIRFCSAMHLIRLGVILVFTNAVEITSTHGQ